MRVKDIFPGPESSFKGSDTLIPAGNEVFFNACAPMTGCELWKSDGTESGTMLVEDIIPGTGSSGDRRLTGTDIGGVLLFTATDGLLGLEPWTSGGTARDTFMLQDIAPGPRSSSPEFFTRAGENVFFVADDGATGRELWVFQGSAQNVQISRKKHPKVKHGTGHSRSARRPTPDKDQAPVLRKLESVVHKIRD
jgi:ELWxxDGT repeat protein